MENYSNSLSESSQVSYYNLSNYTRPTFNLNVHLIKYNLYADFTNLSNQVIEKFTEKHIL